ncbi:MAG: hypothetical protein IPH77_15575 [Ignavibacteria bacterium]|nr:hypothetical protein [Ignavibacteria bacterium]
MLDRQSGNIEEIKKIENDPDSLSDNFISQVFEDSNGTLWIGTREGGLNKFNFEKNAFTKYRHNRTDPNSIGNDTIMSIYERTGQVSSGLVHSEKVCQSSVITEKYSPLLFNAGVKAVSEQQEILFCEDRIMIYGSELWIQDLINLTGKQVLLLIIKVIQ